MANEQVHGHEVIDIFRQHPGGITLTALAQTVRLRFGGGTRFFTCSAEGMTLDEVLRFLSDRRKLQVHGDTVFPGDSPACNQR